MNRGGSDDKFALVSAACSAGWVGGWVWDETGFTLGALCVCGIPEYRVHP